MFSKHILWQGLIEDMTEDFLSFFYPTHFHLLDLERGFESVSLPRIGSHPDNSLETRPLTQLISGYLDDGTATRFLLYLDLFGNPPPDLGKTLFFNASNVLKRYGEALNTLVLFLGPPNEFHVAEYFQEFWKGAILFSFLSFELHEKIWEELLHHPSIIGIVLATARLHLIHSAISDSDLFDKKQRLIQTLFSRDYPIWKIRRVLNFIRFYTPFTQSKFDRQLVKITRQEDQTGIALGMEAHMLRELEENLIEKGVKQGRIQEKRTAAWNLLFSPDFQSGAISLDLISNVTGLSKEEIGELYRGMEGSNPL